MAKSLHCSYSPRTTTVKAKDSKSTLARNLRDPLVMAKGSEQFVRILLDLTFQPRLNPQISLLLSLPPSWNQPLHNSNWLPDPFSLEFL